MKQYYHLPRSPVFAQAEEAAQFLKNSLDEALLTPKVAIVCGSGLGGLADTVREKPRIEYQFSSIPYFPLPTVLGHAGKLIFGILGENIPVVLMVGRAHYYEGHSMGCATFPIRVFKLLGVEMMILTNASGGLNPEYAVGDITVINDHIFLAGLAGVHPLRGPNEEDFGIRFPSLSDAYDLELRRFAHQAWTKMKSSGTRRFHEGVYAFVSGPRQVTAFNITTFDIELTGNYVFSYETRAECRMLRQLGADLVGMSTVPEIIVARHSGMRVLALSLVTNNSVLSPVPRGDNRLLQGSTADALNDILEEGKADHEEVLEAGRLAAKL